MPRPRRPLPVLLLVAALLGSACAGGGAEDERPLVIASTAVWGEVLDALDPGDLLRIEVLLPPGADPHEFAPSSAQAADLRRADLVVVNGLGLEAGFEDAIEAAAADGVPVFSAAEAADPLPFDDDHQDEGEHEDEEEGAHGAFDPHVWLDPLRIGMVAGALAGELDGRFEGVGATDAATAYAARMETLTEDIEALLADVVDRRLVTNHDALGYFADRFGFEVIGVVIPGGSTDAAPNSRALAALADLIDAEGIGAILVDTAAPATVAEALAAEFAGSVAVVPVVTAGPDDQPPTDTIEGFLLENARRIADALGEN